MNIKFYVQCPLLANRGKAFKADNLDFKFTLDWFHDYREKVPKSNKDGGQKAKGLGFAPRPGWVPRSTWR